VCVAQRWRRRRRRRREMGMVEDGMEWLEGGEGMVYM
jgi:hypothetical protein